MKELGELLRTTREQKGISLKDIQESTKIRLTYLEAIERGDLAGIPGEVYRKGFISNYAAAVGLDSQAILERYNRIKTEMEQPAPSGSTPMIAKPVVTEKTASKENPGAKEKPKKTYRLKSPISAVILGILVGLAIFGLIFGKTLKIMMGTTKTAVSNRTKIVASHKKKSNVKPFVKPAEQPLPSETVVKQIYPAPVTIMATFTEPVWVRIYVDGKMFQEKTFTASDAQQLWTAQQKMTLHIGNLGGIKLVLNGKNLGSLGERGQEKIIKLTPQGIEPSTDEAN